MAEAIGPAVADRVPLIDAGRDEVFGARFDACESPPRERTAPWLGDPERALESGEAAVLFGSGVVKHCGRLVAAGWNGSTHRAPTSVAAAVGRIAAGRLKSGAEDGEGMSPLYLRPPYSDNTRAAP
jgi:tRNA A37 threonylcarbamoyladenosine modification protein TsaB